MKKKKYVKPINESYIMPVLAKVAIVEYGYCPTIG